MLINTFKNLHTKYGKYLWLLVLLPPLVLLYLVVTRSVNVPFWDQWELVPIIKNVQEGHFYIHDFWQQHNEHRLLIPRIIMMTLAIFTRWNDRYEVIMNVLLAIGSFGLVLSLFLKTSKQLRQKASVVAVFITSMIWFSPVQQENWLWGWQIQWFVSVLGMVMVLYALSDAAEDRLTWPKVLFLVAGGAIAQYSLGNGVLIWPLAIASLLLLRTELKKVLSVTGAAVVTTGLFYLNYHSVANTPSKLEALHKPVMFLEYIFIYLGRPLSFLPKVTPLFGFFLVGTFVGLVIWLFLKHRRRFETLLPWIAMGGYAILSAAITADSRLNLGLAQAYSSRYTTISTLLLVSVIALIFFNLDELYKFVPTIYKPLLAFGIAGLVFVVGLNAVLGVMKMDAQHIRLVAIRDCTHQAELTRGCLLSAYPDEYIARDRLNYLKRIHWGGY